MSLGTPCGSINASDCGVVSGLRHGRAIRVFGVQELVEALCHDPANGVDAIVSGQALPFEPGHRSDDGVQPFRNLVLDDRMEGCVCLEVWQLESLGSVQDLDQTDPLLFVKRQPLLRIWRLTNKSGSV